MIDLLILQARRLREQLARAEAELRAGRLVAAERELVAALATLDAALETARKAGVSG